MKEIIIDKLSYPIRLIDLLWDLRTNPKNAFSLIDVDSKDSIKRCLLDLGVFFAFFWLIIEIAAYFFDLKIFSKPTLYYQVLSELNFLLSSIPLFLLFRIRYRKDKYLNKKGLLISILYIYMSNVYWFLWLKGLTWILSLIGINGINSYLFAIGKIFIFFHGIFILILLLKNKGIIKEEDKHIWVPVSISTLGLNIIFSYIIFWIFVQFL